MKTRFCIVGLCTLLPLPLLQLQPGRQRVTAYEADSEPKVRGYSQETIPGDLLTILNSNSVSPYDLERFIKERDESEEGVVDFSPIWDKFQIPRDKEGYFDAFVGERYQPVRKVPSYDRWRAKTIDVASPQGRIAILEIAMYGGSDRRYLVFDTNESELDAVLWHFSGYIDVLNNYEGSDANDYYRVVSSAGHVWLVLRANPHLGTGVEDTEEMWYQIDGQDPRQVLKYPVDGARVMGELCDLEYTATIAETEFPADVVTQRIRYQVNFGASSHHHFGWLFSKTVLVSFVWDEDAQRFVVDRSRSNITAEEVEDCFGSWDEEKFIRYNLQQLLRLAKRAKSKQREWYEHTIDGIRDASERSELLNALNE